MSNYQLFLRQVKARTDEHKKAFNLLYGAEHYGVCIGIIRQEIDSMMRVAYLWEPETPIEHVLELIESSVNKGEWKATSCKGKPVRVMDRKMLDCALTQGWEEAAYEFGCRLIHLSNTHSYKEIDPTWKIPLGERQEIAFYMKERHGFQGDDVTMADVIAHLPKIFEKIWGNTEFYVKDLEQRLEEEGGGL